MNKSLFTSKGSRLGLLVVQLLLVLLCAGYVGYVYYADIIPEKQVKKSFTLTNCSILNKRLSEKGSDVKKYRADFLISYTVKNVQYNRWVSGDGLEMLFDKVKSNQDELLTKYNVDKTYACWYNPLIPQVAVLVLKHNWAPTMPLLAPIIIGLVFLTSFLITLFRFSGVKRIKAKKPKTKPRTKTKK
jgi:hypothetical protein